MPFRVTHSVARNTLLAVWFVFFGLNIGIVLYLYLGEWIEKDNFNSAISQLNVLYVTYLGVIVTFYLTAKGRLKGRSSGETTAMVVALTASLIWNTTIFLFLGRLVLGSGTIEDSVEQIGYFGSRLSWLVAPAIGYYFAKASSS